MEIRSKVNQSLFIYLFVCYREFSIFYIGTKTGHIYKVSQWTDDDGKLQSQLLDSFQGTVEEEPIRAMEISRSRRQLYITSDTGIRQIDLSLCSVRYDTCLQCSRDPGCGWDREAGACRYNQPDRF